jgi:hypothetical protein
LRRRPPAVIQKLEDRIKDLETNVKEIDAQFVEPDVDPERRGPETR